MSLSITPRKKHRFVETLCSSIIPDGKPITVQVDPDPNAKLNECFINVREKISHDGGLIKYGWCIWELSGLFIEAECHGVWVSPAGQMVDVTPKHNGATEIMFLPDDSVVFDEATFNRRDNIRMAIKDHPVVHEFLKSAADYVRYLEE